MLTKRQELILKAIVDEFTKTAEPVGSKSLIDLLEIKYSSATLRNEMAVLEELELLEKMHTSSGRIPSNKGYRYYVEHLMERQLDEKIVEALNEIFYSRQLSNEEIMKESCRILSEMTSLTSIVLGSSAKYARLAHIQVFPINDCNAIAVFICDDGHTETKNFVFEEKVSIEDIQSCCNVLNHHLQGTPISELTRRLDELRPILQHISNRYEIVFQAMMNAFLNVDEFDVMYTSGKTNLLYQPEFMDVERIREIMEMMEHGNVWRELGHYADSLNVRIGEVNDKLAISDLSIISSPFEMNDHSKGQLMIVGPTRMAYNQVISLLEYVSSQLEIIYRRR